MQNFLQDKQLLVKKEEALKKSIKDVRSLRQKVRRREAMYQTTQRTLALKASLDYAPALQQEKIAREETQKKKREKRQDKTRATIESLAKRQRRQEKEEEPKSDEQEWYKFCVFCAREARAFPQWAQIRLGRPTDP